MLALFLAVLAAVLTCLAISACLFEYTVARKKKTGNGPSVDTGAKFARYLPLIAERKKWFFAQKPEQVSILSEDGLKLSGFYLPAEQSPAKGLVICFHGYMSHGVNDFAPMSPFYHRLGYGMLIVDNRAHGRSEGRYMGMGCLDRFDCLAWARYAAERFGQDCPIVLHGISMGAAAVLNACELPLPGTVAAVISDCGFTSAWDELKWLLKRNYRLPAFPLLHMTNAICQARAGYRFDSCAAVKAVRNSEIPALFIHGSQDDFVPLAMGKQNFEACASKKWMAVIQGARHADSYYRGMDAYERSVESFLSEL